MVTVRGLGVVSPIADLEWIKELVLPLFFGGLSFCTRIDPEMTGLNVEGVGLIEVE